MASRLRAKARSLDLLAFGVEDRIAAVIKAIE